MPVVTDEITIFKVVPRRTQNTECSGTLTTKIAVFSIY